MAAYINEPLGLGRMRRRHRAIQVVQDLGVQRVDMIRSGRDESREKRPAVRGHAVRLDQDGHLVIRVETGQTVIEPAAEIHPCERSGNPCCHAQGRSDQVGTRLDLAEARPRDEQICMSPPRGYT
ncbi:hypothetical protein ACFRCI_24675 [Streptomyces sp. NPDC056638]|uniref:hypothetical protein n=1 Tax=Streptomyces sp. NPDC056638 TaxID=3345887 RepID=UPI00367D866C